MSLAGVVAALAVFAFGMVTVFPGSVKLRLVDRVPMDDARVGRMITVWQFTTLILTLFVGPLLDNIGHKYVLAAGFIIVAIGIWAFAFAQHPSGAFLASMLLGIGGSCVNAGGNTLLTALNPTNPSAASNIGNAFYGLGAFTVPFVVAFLFQRISYTAALSVFGVISAAGAIPTLLATYPAVSSGTNLLSMVSLLGNPVVLLAGFILFCYVGLEVSSASWTTTYLRKVGFAEKGASIVFSLFWIAMIAGRLITARFVTTAIGKPTVQAVALAAAAALLLMTLTMNRIVAGGLAILLGFFYAPIFPTTVGLTYSKVGGANFGSVFAIMFAIALLGPSTIPAMIGYVSKTRSIHAGYRLMVLLAGVLFLLAFGF
jgi:fucose permease